MLHDDLFNFIKSDDDKAQSSQGICDLIRKTSKTSFLIRICEKCKISSADHSTSADIKSSESKLSDLKKEIGNRLETIDTLIRDSRETKN